MPDALLYAKLRVWLCRWRWKPHRRGSWLKARIRRLRRFATRANARALIMPSCPASLFTLEPLEARILLAADLNGVVQSAAQLDPAVPTNTAAAVVQVQNVGNQRVTQSQVGIYASLDTMLGASDILLGTANTGQLNAGQSKNVSVALTVPNTLDPTAYRLLAKLDHANAITENSETNNVAVGGTMNVAWKFGAVPGRSGNTTLTLKDADGTNVTFSLSGAGLGEVLKVGTNWDVKVTGTTATSAVTILTNTGGNNRVTLNDIHVFGPLAAFTAGTTDLTGTLAIDGPVTIPGLLPGTITLGSIQGGTVAVPSVEAFTVLGAATNAKIYVGTTFGQDGQPGGTGTNADTYGAGTIGLFTVTEAMSGTAVRVGINPVDGLYGNGNDLVVGGPNSSIGGMIIGGALSADTRFYAGAFPTQYLLGLSFKPTAGDGHFVSNFSGPTLTAALQQDTGSSAIDKLTNNPAITGSVTDSQGIATFRAGFGATPAFNILADRQANGSFTLSPARLEQINGGPLTDGPLTLTLRATDSAGNVTQTSVPFTLDRTVTTLTLELAAASDTPPVGDQQTMNTTVTLTGQTDATARVELVGLGVQTTADATGAFSFSNVALAVGANTFTVRATDPAGNQRTTTKTITRSAADSDGDGVLDTAEGGGPNNGDANGDSIPDSQQANVTSLRNAIDQQYVTLIAPIGTTLRNVQAGQLTPGVPDGVTFPFGQIGFEVHGVTPGGSAQVTMLLPTGSLVNTFYKYGPEAAAPLLNQPHWYEFTQAGGTGAIVSGDTVTLSLIDGSRGDSDLAANGVIVDPGAPAASASTAVRWVNPNGGDWHTASNWSTGFVPTADQDVVIDLLIQFPITVNSGTAQAKSITSVVPIRVQGATLQVGTLDGVVSFINGGTLRGAAIDGVVRIENDFLAPPTILDGVTVSVNARLFVLDGAKISIRNGLNVNGEMQLLGSTSGSEIWFDGNESLLGSGQIKFIGGGNNLLKGLPILPAGEAAITIGPNLTVQGYGRIGEARTSIINQGTISANISNQVLQVTNVTNLGTLNADNAGTLDLKGSWTNTAGTVSVTSQGMVNLGGTFTPGKLGSWNRAAGSVVSLTGILNNSGTTWNADTTTGRLVITANGKIEGGTITGTGLILTSSTAGSILPEGINLDGVTISSGAEVRVENGAALTFANGLILNGRLSLGSGVGLMSAVIAVGNQTISGNGDLVFLKDAGASIQPTSGSTLTLGAGITTRGTDGALGTLGSTTATIINLGTIRIDGTSIPVELTMKGVSNQGLIEFSGRTTISVEAVIQQGQLVVPTGIFQLGMLNSASSFLNEGQMELGDNALMSLAGSMINQGSLTLRKGSSLTVGQAFSNTGTLSLDIAGTSSFGKLFVNGSSDLSGVLNVALVNGFVPGDGNRFQILSTNGGRNGLFNTTNLPALQGGLQFVIDQNDPTDLELVATSPNQTPVITSNGGGKTAQISMSENITAVTTVSATDPNGDTLQFSLSGPDAGKIELAGTGNSRSLRFLAAPDFETPGSAHNGNVYSFVVTVSDGRGGTVNQTLDVTVTNANDAPDAVNDNRTTNENVALTFDPQSNDGDQDPGDALTITGVTQGAKGTVSFTDSSVTYTPNPNTNGADNFTYTIRDLEGAMDTATVTITVTPAVAGVRWINPAGGDWNVASNWSTGVVPTMASDVIINLPGSYSVTHSTGTTQIKSLKSEHQINLAGGTLTVTEPIQMNGALLSLAGGTLKNSTVMGTGVSGRVMEVVGSGTVEGITLEDSDSVISIYVSSGAELTVLNGLILNGSSTTPFSGAELIVDGGSIVASTLPFGSQTIGGTSGAITLRGGGSLTTPGATLILGQNISLVSERGSIGSPDGGIVLMGSTGVTGNGSLDTINVRNIGHIQVNGKVGPSDVGGMLVGTGFFANQGSIEAQNGSSLTFANFDNDGAIRILQPGLNPVITFTMTGTNPLFNNPNGTIEIWNDLKMVLDGSLLNLGRVFTGQEVAPDTRGVIEVSGDVTAYNSPGAGIWLHDGEMRVQGTLLNLGAVHLETGHMQAGDYVQEQGTLSTNLTSLTEFGRLDVERVATLNGTLSVALTGTPTIGDRYRFMTFVSRQNSSFAVLQLSSNLSLDDTDLNSGFLELVVI